MYFQSSDNFLWVNYGLESNSHYWDFFKENQTIRLCVDKITGWRHTCDWLRLQLPADVLTTSTPVSTAHLTNISQRVMSEKLLLYLVYVQEQRRLLWHLIVELVRNVWILILSSIFTREKAKFPDMKVLVFSWKWKPEKVLNSGVFQNCKF